MVFSAKFTILIVIVTVNAAGGATIQDKISSKFFGNSWSIPFEENAQTLPSIGIKLEPPEDPLPQISAEIQIRERKRIQQEESFMARLEDKFNQELDLSQQYIERAVARSMRIFASRNILNGIVKGSLLPITTRRAAIKATKGSFYPQNIFQQAARNLKATLPIFRQPILKPLQENSAISENRAHNHHSNGPINPQTSMVSFLAVEEHLVSSLQAKSKNLGNVLVPYPSVKIQVTDIREPDAKIKGKMDEIEQLRSDEESKIFEQAANEFSQLRRITIRELEKNIQIQMNPFLVDAKAVAQQLDSELPKHSTLKRLFQFRQLHSKNGASAGSSNLPATSTDLPGNISQANNWSSPLSFLAVSEETSVAKGLPGKSLEKQLNVKILQSDKPYPTIDELVSDMEKKRDATERLERVKVLELQLKLIKAQDEMIRDALRVHISRVISQYGPAIEAIKTEIAVEKLR